MRIVSVDRLQVGDTLGRAILDVDGRILLQAGVSLTQGYIRKLQQMDFNCVYIQDGDTYDVLVEETVPLEVQQEVLMKVKAIHDKLADPKQSQELVESGRIGTEFQAMFKVLFESLMSDRTFIVNLSAIHSSDTYLYTHCMNVGTMATILAMAYGFNEDRTRKFGLGAMLHDIGKLRIDKSILDKPGKLTAAERIEIEKHCQLGYDILIRQSEIATVSAHCALQHHEKFDGTGYPRRLKGTEIHEFGRMLAVPDVYDALTSNRVYKKAMLPHEAVEFLYAQSGSHFDPTFVDLFMKHINIYPNGLPVELSNGLAGVVARMNIEHLHRPVILVLSEDGRRVKPYEVNLLSELNLTITGCDIEGSHLVRG